MTPTDVTPPANFPAELIMFDPEYGFWLRIADNAGGSFCPHEGYFTTLPTARLEAHILNFAPTAWVDADGRIIRF